MTYNDSYDKALEIYLRLFNYSAYIPILDISGMIRNTDGYLVEEDDTGFNITYRKNKGKKREEKKQ